MSPEFEPGLVGSAIVPRLPAVTPSGRASRSWPPRHDLGGVPSEAVPLLGRASTLEFPAVQPGPLRGYFVGRDESCTGPAREKQCGDVAGRDCRVEQVEAPELKPNGRRRREAQILGWRIRRVSPEGGRERRKERGGEHAGSGGGEALAGRKLS